jgi:hypothetical protein
LYESNELGNLVGYDYRGEYCYSSIEEAPADAWGQIEVYDQGTTVIIVGTGETEWCDRV